MKYKILLDMINRIFKADTPIDVICAGLVAGSLPRGRDVLAVSTDKSQADGPEYVDCLRAVSRLHGWYQIVDISGLPLKSVMDASQPLSWWSRLRKTLQTMSILRTAFALAFGLDPNPRRLDFRLDSAVDEVYFTLITHPDVQALYTLFPRARKVVYPHGFGNFDLHEIHYFDDYFFGHRGNSTPAWRKAVDALKGHALGRDAVPVRYFPLDAAYYFRRPGLWDCLHLSLSELENRGTAESVFDVLPEDVRQYYRVLAGRGQDATGLLILTPEEVVNPAKEGMLLDVYGSVVEEMIRADKVTRVLIKPHPRNSPQLIRKVSSHLNSLGYGVSIEVIERFALYPIQIVLAPFSNVVCGTLISSSLRDIAVFYGFKCYCPESRFGELFSDSPLGSTAIDKFVEEYKEYYTVI